MAIAQVGMHWTTAENVSAIGSALTLARAHGAAICAFAELAVTGFHREIAREARAESVGPAIERVRAWGADASLAIAIGAPTFGADGLRFNSHVLIDESGCTVAVISKRGLTDPEATFFARGTSRPIGILQGLRCSAVICREVGDLEQVASELEPGSVDLIFVPGALRQDPDKPRTDPPGFVHDIQRLAQATQAFVVHTNWPNALNRPEEGADLGGSVVAGPDGEVLFRLPMQAAGIGIFELGARAYAWHPQ